MMRLLKRIAVLMKADAHGIVESLEELVEPRRDRRADRRRELSRLGDIGHGENARDDFEVDAGSAGPVDKAQHGVVLQAELGDRLSCTGGLLALEVLDLRRHVEP